MRLIITNADDFGLTSGVNRAVRELHACGLLSSTTLMARAEATEEAIDIALSTPTLGVGCHVVLVDGEPVLPAHQLPTLVDAKTGRFHATLGRFLVRLLSGRIRSNEIEAEAGAQMALLRGRGVQLTHVDTHKHTHMFAGVLLPLLRAATANGVVAVRNPFEPLWSVRATPQAPALRRLEVTVLGAMARTFHRHVRESGRRTTAGALGVLATGTLDAATVAALMSALPSERTNQGYDQGYDEQIYELVLHPGYNDAALAQAHTRLLESREVERGALSALIRFPGIAPVSFSALACATVREEEPPGSKTLHAS